MSVAIFLHFVIYHEATLNTALAQEPQDAARSLTEVAGTGGLSPAGVPVAEVAHRAAVIVVVI